MLEQTGVNISVVCLKTRAMGERKGDIMEGQLGLFKLAGSKGVKREKRIECRGVTLQRSKARIAIFHFIFDS